MAFDLVSALGNLREPDIQNEIDFGNMDAAELKGTINGAFPHSTSSCRRWVRAADGVCGAQGSWTRSRRRQIALPSRKCSILSRACSSASFPSGAGAEGLN